MCVDVYVLKGKNPFTLIFNRSLKSSAAHFFFHVHLARNLLSNCDPLSSNVFLMNHYCPLSAPSGANICLHAIRSWMEQFQKVGEEFLIGDMFNREKFTFIRKETCIFNFVFIERRKITFSSHFWSKNELKEKSKYQKIHY